MDHRGIKWQGGWDTRVSNGRVGGAKGYQVLRWGDQEAECRVGGVWGRLVRDWVSGWVGEWVGR